MFLKKELSIEEDAQVSPDFTWDKGGVSSIWSVPEVYRRVQILMLPGKVEGLRFIVF